MFTGGKEGAVKFFNSLPRVLDTSQVIRMDVSIGEVFLGLVQTFILWWLMGVCIAAFYNAQIKEKQYLFRS